MFAKAAALSLALLVLSRLLGLLRESAQAAAFGATGMADVAVLMLTLPDWLVGLLASGALAYVLMPVWAALTPAQVAASQRIVARWLMAAGVTLAGLLALAVLAVPATVLGWLAPGLPAGLHGTALEALQWSAAALPAALLATLWVTRLQHERDFAGMYSANLVVNGVLIFALLFIATRAIPASSIAILGMGLLAAMGLRLAWLAWRSRHHLPAQGAAVALPAAQLWLWAGLSSGLPLALPFVARSLASQQGEGALAIFNYAWKLVELPLVLAIQLVASLAFPGIARALAGTKPTETAAADDAVSGAFALAWTLACAAAAALLVGAPALAQLLFGWGRMQPEALAQIADWGRTGAWGLLPQALIAVALTVLAAQNRMRAAVVAYSAALLALLAVGRGDGLTGGYLMAWLNGLYAVVALVCLAAALRGNSPQMLRWLPLRALAGPLLSLLAVAALNERGFLQVFSRNVALELAVCALAAIVVIATGLLASPTLRRVLRR